MYMAAASLGLGGQETYACPPPASLGCFFSPDDDGLLVAKNCAAATVNFPQPPPVPVADEYCFPPEPGVHPPAYYSSQVFPENEMNMPGFADDGRMMMMSRAAAAAAGNNVVGLHHHRTPSRIGFRTRSGVDVLDDGFRWRKYGKKAVKSSPNPRNYYRCAVEGCGVKKRVERDRHDPRYVVTTYDGVHNHAAAPPHACAAGHRAPPHAAVAVAAAPNSDAWGVHQQLHAAATTHSSESSY